MQEEGRQEGVRCLLQPSSLPPSRRSPVRGEVAECAFRLQRFEASFQPSEGRGSCLSSWLTTPHSPVPISSTIGGRCVGLPSGGIFIKP